MFGWTRRKRTKREIFINAESLETRVAVMENGKLEEFEVEHPTEQRLVGSIFKGKIQNLEHDLQAAFVDIGMKKNAFLHYWDMFPDVDEDIRGEVDRGRRKGRRPKRKRFSNQEVEKRFPPGSEIVVQVAKGPIGTKGPRVTASLSIPGRYLVLMPGSGLKGVSRKIDNSKERQRLKKLLEKLSMPQGVGVIVRTVAAEARKRNLLFDIRALTAAWEDLQRLMREEKAPVCLYKEPDLVERVVRDWLTENIDRIIIDSREQFERIRDIAGRISRRQRSKIQLYDGELPVFDHFGIETQLGESFRRKVTLKCGGYVVFDETEALIAIDVNTGRHKGSGSQVEGILEVNTEAVEEVARQLRLRNVGGLVVIDLIDMKAKRHQNSVFKAMKAAVKDDRARTNILPISDLGIMEMTRQRVEESVLSSMYVDCPYCAGKGSVKSPLGMSVDIQRQIAAVMRKRRKSDEGHDLQVVVHPTVLDRLRTEDEQFLIDLQSRLEGRLSFKSDPSRHVECFLIIDPETGENLYSSKEK